MLVTILQVSGAVALTIAGFFVATALGFAVLGVGLLTFGLALERK